MTNLTEIQVNEICKAHVFGRTVEDISTIMEIDLADVEKVLADNSARINELTEHYKLMEVL